MAEGMLVLVNCRVLRDELLKMEESNLAELRNMLISDRPFSVIRVYCLLREPGEQNPTQAPAQQMIGGFPAPVPPEETHEALWFQLFFGTTGATVECTQPLTLSVPRTGVRAFQALGCDSPLDRPSWARRFNASAGLR